MSHLSLSYTLMQTRITTEILYSSAFWEKYFILVALLDWKPNSLASAHHKSQHFNFYTSYQEILTSSSSSFSSIFASLLALSRTAANVLSPSIAATPGSGGNPKKERNTEGKSCIRPMFCPPYFLLSAKLSLSKYLLSTVFQNSAYLDWGQGHKALLDQVWVVGLRSDLSDTKA